ncbi:MAG: hypothetical protein K9N49_00715 [Candidatus Marinimicrobia bacterium]|nr:hypothetical protein [Candidatus Neomarinimicrobiota bacterium]
MTEQSVACGFCGQIVYAAPEALRQGVSCPACGKRVSAAAPIAAAEAAPSGAGRPPLAGGPSFGRLVLAGLPSGVLAAVLTLLGAWLLWRPGVQPAPDPVAVYAPEWAAPPGAAGARRENTAAVAESAPAALEQTARPAAARPATGPTPEQQRARLLAELRRQLDETHPLFQQDERVALREVTGRLHRGAYLGRKTDSVVVLRDGEPVEVALRNLDGTTRIRCEPAYRDAYLEQLADRRLREAAAPTR